MKYQTHATAAEKTTNFAANGIIMKSQACKTPLFQYFVAREKLDIPAGNKLVLEENGNEIDEDDVLLLMLEEHRILLLLGNGERWRPDGGTIGLRV